MMMILKSGTFIWVNLVSTASAVMNAVPVCIKEKIESSIYNKKSLHDS